MHIPVPVHVGHRLPSSDDGHDDQVVVARQDFGEQVRVSALDKAEVDWTKREIEPRWIGSETVDCVAALQPGIFSSQGASERDRFLAGTAERSETALVISMLGFAHDTKPRGFMSPGGGDSVDLAMTRSIVHGRRLPTPTKVRLAAGLTRADEDLGKRLLNRPLDAPWWSLTLRGRTMQPGSGGPPTTYATVGELLPILVDPLGEPVVGVWVSPAQIRWYILPDDINWNVVLDWLVHQALPAYAPDAAKRHRTSSFLDTNLLTPAENDAQQALVDMEIRHAEERARLEAAMTDARREAAPLRDGLFYGTGAELVDAVGTVLRAAGFEVVDLDKELGGTRSADLLATLGDHRRLIEVKSEGRNANESLVNDLRRHIQTWPELRPELPVGGGALVVNHQHRLPPDRRSPTVYNRREFVDTLTVPVLPVRDLFDWWKVSEWTAIQRAVLGTEPPSNPSTTPTPSRR